MMNFIRASLDDGPTVTHQQSKSRRLDNGSSPSFSSMMSAEVATQNQTHTIPAGVLANTTSELDIAIEATKRKLTRSEVIASLSAVNFKGMTAEQISVGVDDFMKTHQDQFGWSDEGTLVETKNLKAAAATVQASPLSVVQKLMARNSQLARDTDRLASGLGFGAGITVGEARRFFANNPDINSILDKASSLSMSDEELASMLTYGRGDSFDPMKVSELVNTSSQFGFDEEGRICSLDGAIKQSQNGNSMLSIVRKA